MPFNGNGSVTVNSGATFKGTGIMNMGSLALTAGALLVFSRRKGRAQSNPVTAGPNPGTDADFSNSGFLN